MTEHTPPHLMTTAERRNEIARLLALACTRQKIRKNNALREDSAGLHHPPAHSCQRLENKENDDD